MKRSLWINVGAWFMIGTLAPATGSAAAPPEDLQAPVLVELFTSEGCSSCPPADLLLRQVSGSHTLSGRPVVVLSEHVTYWNHLGWRDPYSSEVFTSRQSAYSRRFGLESTYTPQMVVDGSEQFVGSDAAALQRALNRVPDRSPDRVPDRSPDGKPGSAQASLQILSAERKGGRLAIRFSVDSTSREDLHVVGVLVDDHDRSHVLAGENAGSLLEHIAVARSLAEVALKGGAKDQRMELALPAPVAGQATGHHLVLFVQRADTGAVLATAVTPI